MSRQRGGRISHRDLKPANVLCVDGEIKVVDFGIAAQAVQAAKLRGTAAGTVLYMAPELLLGQQPSVESDLYAVGVLGYELLTGHFPFDHANRTRLLAQVLGTSADVTLADDLAEMFNSVPHVDEDEHEPSDSQVARFEARLQVLEPPLQALLRRLLARNPAQRYQDAATVLLDLNQLLDEPLAVETAQLRESFLRASRLVGRDAEVARLLAAIGEAVAGRGSGFLLAGESGVGKSRLLAEARAAALVAGMLVVRGQAVAAGGQPLQLFISVLRHLALYSELSDLAAGVLKTVLPELPALLGRAIPEAPVLDAQATQSRLRAVAEGLLLQVAQPTLLVLEDLQWADSESLALLRRIAGALGGRPLLLVGSYRSDERPLLPGELPQLTVLPLARLNAEGVGELTRAIVGSAADNAELTALLLQETAGNPHFVIEAVRVLADSAGRLAAVGQHDLPAAQIIAAWGGMKEVLRQRLERVPEPARPLLRLAAALGTRLDLRVLQVLVPAPEPGLLALLMAAAAVAVLEVEDGSWRFAHDRLRERLLADLTAEARQELHRQLAGALEQVYGSEPGHAAQLAYHFAQAADPARCAHYAALAGAEALQAGALTEAVALLTKARELHARLDPPPLERARVLRLLASALWGLGRIGDSLPLMESALALLGAPLPPTGLRLGAALLGQSARQLWHRLRPAGALSALPSGERRQLLHELLQVILGSGEMYAWTGEQEKVLLGTLLSVNLAEELDDAPALVMLYAVMGFLGAVLGLPALRERYLAMAEARLGGLRDAKAELELHRITAALHLMTGEWGPARLRYDKAMVLARTLGNSPLYLFCLLQRATVAYWQAEYAAAEADATALLGEAQRDGFPQYEVWALGTLGSVLLRRGAWAQARRQLDAAHALAQLDQAKTARIFVAGQRAWVALQQGERSTAQQLAEAALHEIRATAQTGHGALEGYFGVVTTYLELAADAAPAARRRELLQVVQQALPGLHRYARLVPIGTARAALCQARFAELQGHWPLALKWLRRALRAAQSHGLPYDQALAHLAIGRLASTAALPARERPEPRLHLDAAERLLARCGAVAERPR